MAQAKRERAEAEAGERDEAVDEPQNKDEWAPHEKRDNEGRGLHDRWQEKQPPGEPLNPGDARITSGAVKQGGQGPAPAS